MLQRRGTRQVDWVAGKTLRRTAAQKVSGCSKRSRLTYFPASSGREAVARIWVVALNPLGIGIGAGFYETAESELYPRMLQSLPA